MTSDRFVGEVGRERCLARRDSKRIPSNQVYLTLTDLQDTQSITTINPVGDWQGLAVRGRSPIFTKRIASVRSGESGSQIFTDRVLDADERLFVRAGAPTE